MSAVLFSCLLLTAVPQVPDCADVSSCRQAAVDAASRGEFEVFHDLAWRAAQKGRRNDPELMALVARAQSLSGRPGDALVMLRRLADMGVSTDAATSDDFRRVRALSGWPEVEALLKDGSRSTVSPPAAASTVASPPAPAPTAGRPVEPARAAAAADVAVAGTPSFEEESLPLPLASIEPAGLAHDAVSRRFIVGDRRQNKLVIFDEVFKRATDMVGADSGGFFGLTAIEIDPLRGDLWVANSSAVRGASLHKLQLVSGRVLFELAVPPALGPATLVDIAALADGQVLMLDGAGRRLLGVSAAGRAVERVAAIDVEGATSLASGPGRVVYVAHRDGVLRVDTSARTASPVRGAPEGLQRIRVHGRALVAVQSHSGAQRVVRLRLDGPGRRVIGIDVLDESAAMPDPSAMTIAGGTVYYITTTTGAPMMRRLKLGK